MPRIQAAPLLQFAQALLQSLGGPADEVALVARLLVDADLSGHDSHGVIQIPGYLDAHAEGLIAPGTGFTHERETAATALLDGHWGFGHRLAYEAITLGIDKARRCGIGAIGAYHCYHVGHLGAYARVAAEAGMLGIIAVNDGGGGQRVTPYGGIAGRLSTNPLAVGLPTGTAAPFILDMSTSIVAEGQVRLKGVRGEPMPFGWMIDVLGQATTDPDIFFRAAGSLLPLGGSVGYKGYGLGLAVDVLAGILGRAGHSRQQMPPYNNGLFVMVVDIGRFLPLERFTAAVRGLLAHIKSCPRAPGVDEIVYPGERAARIRQYRRRHGIVLDPETWQRLGSIAQERGIQVPDSV
jgi:LDH2 family malate/lactate/ureidoglycolate dehydrogenase